MKQRAIDRALEWAKSDGLNQSELARRIGVLPQDITNWKKRDLPSERYIDVANALNRSIDDLLGRNGYKRDAVQIATSPIPPEGYIRLEHLPYQPSMGRGRVQNVDHIVQHIDVLETFVRQKIGTTNPERVKILTGVGTSMMPVIQDQDIVFVDIEHRWIDAPGYYVLDVAGLLLLKKAMILSTGTLILRSENTSEFPDEERHDLRTVAETITVCGKVLAWWTLRKG